ncbi:HNH endonuclease [Natronococcus sp.]|uniref:HNH endonuclease n=1 Tax=Natronococcus sp. TaxID=35747 RepID=UPI003A4E5714
MDDRLYGHEWFKIRNRILNRDENTCRNCGETTNLVVHHVVPIQTRGTNRPDNLLTLCRDCHRAAHGHRRGRKETSSPPSAARSVFSKSTIADMCSSICHPLSLAMISTVAKTGIGLGELCNLSINDIDINISGTGTVAEFDGSGLIVRYGGNLPYSNRRERNQRTLIPIDNQLEHILSQWLAIRPDHPENDALFRETRENWGERVSPASVRYIFEKVGREHGHYSTDNELNNFTPIALRYFFRERFAGPPHHREYILGTYTDSEIDFSALENEYRRTIFQI